MKLYLCLVLTENLYRKLIIIMKFDFLKIDIQFVL